MVSPLRATSMAACIDWCWPGRTMSVSPHTEAALRISTSEVKTALIVEQLFIEALHIFIQGNSSPRFTALSLCRQQNRRQQQNCECKESVRAESGITVHHEVCDLFRSKKRRREWRNFDRSSRVQIVSVHVEPVVKAPHRES